jgi:hypothetical protein
MEIAQRYTHTIYTTLPSYSLFALKPHTPHILTVNFFFLFQLNAHNILNKHIYHHLLPTRLGVFYTFFRETIALLAQELYAFYTVVTYVLLYNVKYTLFLNLKFIFKFKNFNLKNRAYFIFSSTIFVTSLQKACFLNMNFKFKFKNTKILQFIAQSV